MPASYWHSHLTTIKLICMKVPEIMKIAGILALVIGIGIRFLINRRKFNRRNVAGVEEFSSYTSSVGNRFLEFIGRLISFVLILIGLYVIIVWIARG